MTFSFSGTAAKSAKAANNNGDTEALLNSVLLELEKERTLRMSLESKLKSGCSNGHDAGNSCLQNEERDQDEKLERSSGNIKEERSKDEESEAVIASLIDQVESLKGTESKSEKKVEAMRRDQESAQVMLRKAQNEITRLEVQRNGLIDVIDGMTCDNDAVQAANAASVAFRPTLSPNIVRMLEIAPWHPTIQKCISVTEEVFEWQSFEEDQGWSQNVDFLPAARDKDLFFKILPHKKRSSRSRCDNVLSPNAILTDKSAQKILNIEEDFPLPKEGKWSWIGGWRIDHEPELRTDFAGWSYALYPTYLIKQDTSYCFEFAGKKEPQKDNVTVGNGKRQDPLRKYRMRRWTKTRVLSSYPSICEQTKHFLSIREENANANFSVKKLTEQLVGMQMKITEYEEKLGRFEEVQEQVENLKKELANNNEKIKSLDEKLSKRTGERKKIPSLSSFYMSSPKRMDSDTKSKSERTILSSPSQTRGSSEKKKKSMLPSFRKSESTKGNSDNVLSLFHVNSHKKEDANSKENADKELIKETSPESPVREFDEINPYLCNGYLKLSPSPRCAAQTPTPTPSLNAAFLCFPILSIGESDDQFISKPLQYLTMDEEADIEPLSVTTGYLTDSSSNDSV
mmetsp:Transcript_2/g.2  ORF Transcript_2/g.2 Transcript_2/m.2 type:complete len:627 (-) Transcript_2:95-1975(-)|eukprot:CAMPEP_0172498918 /NCGR_PEP_ID=MMETSP1066-20121228/119540_1 /TAXON_ID=671091 /ORGANISM="Coscinodiscus wailesii, Strain CCMP2513" /LENGTH=626 /DNA_ID=CAMNT_0013272397 /DNA_START=160 /DNA_END=2040 /DNA_ORIENTATION=-